MADALGKLDLAKKELERDAEWEARKTTAVADLKLPSFKLGKQDYLMFALPLKQTGFLYNTETEKFSRKPSILESFVRGSPDINVFGNGHIAYSNLISKTELVPVRTYEGSNAYGVSRRVIVVESREFGVDLPHMLDVEDIKRPRPVYEIPVPRTALGGTLDNVGILILGTLRKNIFASIKRREEPTIDVPLDKQITRDVFFVSPVCAYIYDMKAQKIIAEIPRLGSGWQPL